MADGDRLRLDGEAAHGAMTALGQHVVQQHGVQPADHEIAVRMHVIVVRHHLHPVVARRAQQNVVGDRVAQCADGLAAQVGERSKARRVGVADAQHLAEFVVGQRDRHRRAPRRRVLSAAHADVGVAAGDALVD